MKAPDKKYPLSVVADLLASVPSNKVVFMPDKIYFDGVDTSTAPRLAINEIYIRKDALLEYLTERRKGLSSGDSFVAGERKMLKEIIAKIESL